MELFVLRHGEYEQLYNCSQINIDLVPLEQRRQPVASVFIMLLCAVYYLLYLPCLHSIMRQNNACYQILLYIAVANLSILWILGFLHGWLGLQGAVFCSHPKFIYIAGCFSALFWMAESSAGLLLAAVRCLEMTAPNMANRLFRGRRIQLWLLAVPLYACWRFLFTRPCLFNAIFFQWFFNPFKGYLEDAQSLFGNRMAEIHDMAVAILLPMLYIIFAGVMSFKNRSHRTAAAGQSVLSELSTTKKIITIQIFLIAFMNSLGCTLFILVQHIDFGFFWMNYIDHYMWFHAHGIPPVLYLTMNRTIRSDCRLLLNQLCRKGGTNSNGHGQQQMRTQVQVMFTVGQQQQSRMTESAQQRQQAAADMPGRGRLHTAN